MKQKVGKFELTTERHLARYLANREKRTGQRWEVVERYYTDGARPDGIRHNNGWFRALIRAEDGSTLRIYHTGSYWQAGQKVLAPQEVRND